MTDTPKGETTDGNTADDSDDSGPWLKYKAGELFETGDKIVDILQRTRKCFVFLNAEDNPQWDYHSTCVDGDASSAVAMGLIGQVNASVLRRSSRRRLFGIIADALAYSLDDRVANDERDFFQFARSAVEAARTEALRITYLISATVAVVVIAGSLLPLGLILMDEPYRGFCVCATLASLGAFLSVWLRFDTIPIQTFTTLLYISIGGVSRVVFGAIFGVVFLLFQRAGLLLTILKNGYAIEAAALVAGFSERLIPELLATFESKLGAQSVAKKSDNSDSKPGEQTTAIKKNDKPPKKGSGKKKKK